MYFVIIMAFAFVLSDSLPPEQFNLFPATPVTVGASLYGTLAICLGQVLAVVLLAVYQSRKTVSFLDGTDKGHDDATDFFADSQQNLLYAIAAFLVLTLVCTPWSTLVREGWGLGRIPLFGDLLLLAPMFISLLTYWAVLYPTELRLRHEAHHEDDETQAVQESEEAPNQALQALQSATKRPPQVESTLAGYLGDKLRHQILILAVPMCIIVLAKHLIRDYADHTGLLVNQPATRDLVLNCALGTVSFFVLLTAPLMLRFIWATEPLPAGPLRDRFAATCERIGLRYREILLWHTHGMAVNAAVMGFVAPMRYILISDALLEHMDEEEIEAVFGHEAGHVRHWHLPFFGVFAIVSMYAAGGIMHLLFMLKVGLGDGILQLIALAVLLAMWLFGFSWLSRKFERQADLFGVRCITPDIKTCLPSCPVHGSEKRAGLCLGAANLFGRTLGKIADLNGIPREAPSWRHGSIASRCRLLETFCGDQPQLQRFDRKIIHIKIGLAAAVLIGSIGALWIYYPAFERLYRTAVNG